MENELAERNVDYWVLVTNEENPLGGRPTIDYRLSASFAKKLSMQSKTVKGEQARQYFLKVEEKLKEAAHRIAPMTPLEQLQSQANAILQVNEKVDTLDKKLDRLEADLPILGIEIDKITCAVKKKGWSALVEKTVRHMRTGHSVGKCTVTFTMAPHSENCMRRSPENGTLIVIRSRHQHFTALGWRTESARNVRERNRFCSCCGMTGLAL